MVGEGGSVVRVHGGKGRPGKARQGSQYTPRRGSSHHS